MKKTYLSAGIIAFCALSASVGVQAQDVYLGLGAPGLVTLGYAAPVGTNWGLRADYAGGMNATLDGNRDGVNVNGSLRSTKFGAYADWFPFDNSGFRLVGGIALNNTKAELNATGTGTATINGKTVNMTGETYNITVKMPDTTGYIGLGYGHQAAAKGFGFYLDLGVLLGNLTVSSSTTLVASGKVTQADVDAQSQKLRDGIGSLGFMPSASMGAVYRF
jgi:hypothetical protein